MHGLCRVCTPHYAAIALAVGLCVTATNLKAGDKTSLACPGKNRVLVTAGGGIRGAYQAGAVWYLVHVLNCDFQRFVGTSTGALTAAILAQSADHEDLKKNSKRLVETYRSTKSQDDIVDAHALGALRLVLPHWLGGIDGLHTFGPLIRRLDTQVNFEKIRPGRLSVRTVSLQSGSINSNRLLSLRDQVIGSASIPVAVEPRWARVWTEARIVGRGPGALLTLMTESPPGLPDEQCRIEFGGGNFGCQFLSITREDRRGRSNEHLQFTVIEPVWIVTLRLPDSDLEQIAMSADKPLPNIRFTTKHQIVDGGVIDNIPLLGAFSKEQEIDTIFVLGTGRSTPEDTNFEHQGGLAIASASFELLWDEYQHNSLRSHATGLEIATLAYQARKLRRQVTKWQTALTTHLPPEAAEALAHEMAADDLLDMDEQLAALASLAPDKPSPRVYFFLPGETPFTAAFDAHPEKVRNAMMHGCLLAASKQFGPTDLTYTGMAGAQRYSKICDDEFGSISP